LKYYRILKKSFDTVSKYDYPSPPTHQRRNMMKQKLGIKSILLLGTLACLYTTPALASATGDVTLGFVGRTISTRAFSAAELKAIKETTAYTFKDKNLLASAFMHSSVGNPQFEVLEALGDSMVGAVIASIMTKTTKTAGAFHEAKKAKTNNEYFADRYARLGLDRFLTFNPGTDTATVRANALEALVGAVKLDWEAQHPKAVAGSSFMILTTVVKKLVLDDIRDIPVFVPAPAALTAARVVVPLAGAGSSAKSGKITVVLTARHSSGKTVIHKAKGATEEEARKNVIVSSRQKLRLSALKKAAKKTAEFETECAAKGYTITFQRQA
jgi:hypothetical protein